MTKSLFLLFTWNSIQWHNSILSNETFASIYLFMSWKVFCTIDWYLIWKHLGCSCAMHSEQTVEVLHMFWALEYWGETSVRLISLPHRYNILCFKYELSGFVTAVFSFTHQYNLYTKNKVEMFAILWLRFCPLDL